MDYYYLQTIKVSTRFETVNLKDKCQLHSKHKDYLASKEFLSIHRILHRESTDLSARIRTDGLFSDYVISPTKHSAQFLSSCRTMTDDESFA